MIWVYLLFTQDASESSSHTSSFRFGKFQLPGNSAIVTFFGMVNFRDPLKCLENRDLQFTIGMKFWSRIESPGTKPFFATPQIFPVPYIFASPGD